MYLPTTAEKRANFCSLYLCKLLSALCTSNLYLAQKQHAEKMPAVQAVLQSAGLRPFKSVGDKKKDVFTSVNPMLRHARKAIPEV